MYGKCALLEGEEELQHLQGNAHASTANEADNQACYQVDLAIASDNSMFVKYGSGRSGSGPQYWRHQRRGSGLYR